MKPRYETRVLKTLNIDTRRLSSDIASWGGSHLNKTTQFEDTILLRTLPQNIVEMPGSWDLGLVYSILPEFVFFE